MSKMMRAARLHSIGEPFQVDTISVPDVRPTDVLIEVKAAGASRGGADTTRRWP